MIVLNFIFELHKSKHRMVLIVREQFPALGQFLGVNAVTNPPFCNLKADRRSQHNRYKKSVPPAHFCRQ